MTNPVMIVRNQVRHSDEKPVGRGCWLWCPGCEQIHRPEILGEDGSLPPGPCWDWNGDLERPTFTPSLLVYSSVHLCPKDYEHTEVCEDPDNCGSKGHLILNAKKGTDFPSEEERILGHGKPHIVDPAFGNCHSFIIDGQWQFLSDCAHDLAGMTVPLVPLPDWLVK